jgi:hypothetical protein
MMAVGQAMETGAAIVEGITQQIESPPKRSSVPGRNRTRSKR